MTAKELQNMSNEEYEKFSPFIKKRCLECKYLRASLSWRCTNEEAIKLRRTTFPGVILCTCWKPNLEYIDKQYIPDDYIDENPDEKLTGYSMQYIMDDNNYPLSLGKKEKNNIKTFFKKIFAWFS